MTSTINVSNPNTSPGVCTICIEPAPTSQVLLDIETFDRNGAPVEQYQIKIDPPDRCADVSIPADIWGGFISDPNGVMQKRGIVIT